MYKYLLPLIWLLALYSLVLSTSANTDFRYSYEDDAIIVEDPRPLWHLANFDGAHYQNIARYGYIVKFQTAFFPLYPLLIRGLGAVTGNQLLSGLALSLLFTFLSLSLLFRLTRSLKPVLALLAFPTAFFLLAGYTESLFLFLSLLTWTLSRRRQYLLAGVTGLLASASRFYGILLFPTLLLDVYLHRRPLRQILPLLLIPLGLLVYMAYLNAAYQDPLSFIHSLDLWNKSQITLPLQTVYRYLKIFLTASPTTFVYQIAVLEFASLLAGLYLAYALFSRKRYPEALYVILGTTIPTFTGTLQSLPRYLLVLFPIYLLALKPSLRVCLIILFSFLLQLYLFTNFLSGRFVS